MRDQHLSKEELLQEVKELRTRVAALEQAEAEHIRAREALLESEDVADRRRADQLLRAQRDLAVALGKTSDLVQALGACLDTAIQVSGLDCGGVYLVSERGEMDLVAWRGISPEFAARVTHFDANSLQAQDARAGKPIYTSLEGHPPLVSEPGRSEGVRAFAILPTLDEGTWIATMVLGSRTIDEVPTYARDALETIAAQVGSSIARIRAEQAVKKEQHSLGQLLDVYERHRQLVAYEIHDGVAQPLTGALMTLEDTLRRLQSPCAEATREGFSRASELVREGLDEARRVMRGLRPPILDECGLLPALDSLVREMRGDGALEVAYSLEVQFQRLALPLETAVFRIVQEALTNVRRHSQADRVRVNLVQRGDRLHVEIEDRGVGFDPEQVADHRFGLQGIRDRAELFGGSAIIASAPGQGTSVLVELPVTEIAPRPKDH